MEAFRVGVARAGIHVLHPHLDALSELQETLVGALRRSSLPPTRVCRALARGLQEPDLSPGVAGVAFASIAHFFCISEPGRLTHAELLERGILMLEVLAEELHIIETGTNPSWVPHDAQWSDAFRAIAGAELRDFDTRTAAETEEAALRVLRRAGKR